MQAAASVAVAKHSENGTNRARPLQSMGFSMGLSMSLAENVDDQSGPGLVLPHDFMHRIPENEPAVMDSLLFKKQAWSASYKSQDQETQNSEKWKSCRVVLTSEALYFFDSSQMEGHAALEAVRLVDVHRYGVFKSDHPDKAVGTHLKILSTTPNKSQKDDKCNQKHVGKTLSVLHTAAEGKDFNKSCCFDVKTKEQGPKRGRVYHLCAPGPNSTQRDEWAHAIAHAVDDAHHRNHQKMNILQRIQQKLRSVVIHPLFTLLVGLVIISNFVCNCIEAEWNSEEYDQMFEVFDITFTSAFFIEIALRFMALGPRTFFRDRWNIFDVPVVGCSIAALTFLVSDQGFALRQLNSLRTLRVLRIIRVFRHFRSLQVIISSLFDAIIPVMEALLIMFLVISVYAIVGVSLYRQRTERFRSFSAGVFTMFQVVTGDSWHTIALAASTPHYDDEGNRLMVFDTGPAFFLGTFVMFAGWIILNVVVAVMLEVFLASSSKSKQEKLREETRRLQQHDDKAITAIDPVLDLLLQFKNKDHLNELIEMLFRVMDVHGNGLLEFNDLYEGFQNLKVPIVLEEDWWYSISNGQMDNITLQHFKFCMQRELKVYMETMVADELLSATLSDDSSRNELLALKLLMLNTTMESNSSASSLADAVREIHECMSAQDARMKRIEEALNISIPDDDEIGNAPSLKKDRKTKGAMSQQDLDTGHEDIGAHTARVGKVHRQEAEDGRNKDADQPVQKNHNVGGMPLLAPDPDSGHGDVGAHAARVEEVHRQGAEDGQEEDADQPVEKTHDAGVTTGVKKERRRRKRREGDDS